MPVATGSRTIRFPPTRRAGRVPSRWLGSATATSCGRSWTPPPKVPNRRSKESCSDYFAACTLNTDLIQSKGLTPLDPALHEIAALNDPKRLASLMGGLLEAGSPAPLFRFSVGQDQKDSSKQIAETYQGGLSLPDRDYYLGDSKRYQEIRAQYLAHLTKMFTLAGDSPEKSREEAAAVMKIETALAKGATSRVELRNPENRYHIYTIKQLEDLSPNFDWAIYWKDIKIGHFDTLNVATPEFFKALNAEIESEPVDAWKSYFRWHTIHGSATNLPKPFFDENFAFFGKTLSGQKEPTPRWKQCTAETDRALGEAVGQDWVKQNFPPAAKASMDNWWPRLKNHSAMTSAPCRG